MPARVPSEEEVGAMTVVCNPSFTATGKCEWGCTASIAGVSGAVALSCECGTADADACVWVGVQAMGCTLSMLLGSVADAAGLSEVGDMRPGVGCNIVASVVCDVGGQKEVQILPSPSSEERTRDKRCWVGLGS